MNEQVSDPTGLSNPTDSKDTTSQVSTSSKPLLLSRHYSTLGIHDVFLEPPPIRTLPLQYLIQPTADNPDSTSNDRELLISSTTSTTTNESVFMSWEIVGTIKHQPEDFCVREVLQTSKRIPGIADADMDELRVANLIPNSQLPQQHLQQQLPSNETNVATSTDNDEKRQFEEDVVLEEYLEEILKGGEDNAKNTAESIVRSLENLQISAIERIKSLENGADPSTLDCTEPVWIPPLVLQDVSQSSTASPSAASPPSLREIRGKLHRALKDKYPLLNSRSTTKDGVEHWISVQADTSYDRLTPLLLNPQQDIASLLSFQKKGFRGVTGNTGGNFGQVSSKILLKLKPSVSKDERRSFHRLVSERCKYFVTDTIADVAVGDGTTTTTAAVQVAWQKGMIQQVTGSRKRKRGQGLDGTQQSPYRHVLVVFKKRQKEHLTAVQKITQVVRCRQADIGVAGIKDLQAVTYQFCTFRNFKPQRIMSANKQLQKSGIELGNCYQVDWVLNKGDLEGNKFEIILRDMKRVSVDCRQDVPARETLVTCEEAHVAQMVARLQRSGFINFFGEQRVGSAGETDEVGVRAFDIGRAMMQQKFDLAVDLLLTGRTSETSRESATAIQVRKTWKETSGDPEATLKAFQGAEIMTREKLVLKGLKRYGKDRPLDALRCLSHSMRTFWINAYQSYVWNQCASARIQKHGNKVVKGDLYQVGDDDQVQIVGEDDKSVLLSQVVLPLPGYNVIYPENDIGTLYQDLLERDEVRFEKTAPEEATAKGSYRRLVVQIQDMQYDMLSADSCKFTFQLPKGCYATMCLRELMLTTATR